MAQKDATPFTEAANKTLLNEPNWEDTRDFEAAARGFIASLDEPVITSDNGRPTTAAVALAAGEATIDGDPQKLIEFLSMLDTFEFWFNIVTP